MDSAKSSPLRPLSLNTAGPRLLQLCSSPSPASPSAAAMSPSRPAHLKRASTISYSPRSPSTGVPHSPARDRPPSSGAKFPQSRRASLRIARHTSYDPSLALDPMLSSPLTSPPITAASPAEEPLTLVERYVGRPGFCHYIHPSSPLPLLMLYRYVPYRHAELLQKIAAKEAICLDLRTHLAVQEDELKALKAEWNSIVNRDAPQSMTSSSSSSNMLSQGKDLVNGLFAIANAAGSGSNVSSRDSLLFPLVPQLSEREPAAPIPPPAFSKGHLAHARSASATPSDSSRTSSVSGSSLARNSVSSTSSITDGTNLHMTTLNSGHTQHGVSFPGPSSIPLAWTATLPSLDSLPGTFNKKWEEIQKNETYVVFYPSPILSALAFLS